MLTYPLIVEKISVADWPPGNAGKMSTLEALFEPAVRLETSRRADPLPASPSLWRPREVFEHLANCIGCERGTPHLHLLIVPRFDEVGTRPAASAIEWPGARRFGRRRVGVVAWEAITALTAGYDDQTARRLYFRIVAHEIGHILGLDHEQAETLMTPLAWFRQRRAYPRNVAVELSSRQRTRLVATADAESAHSAREAHREVMPSGGRSAEDMDQVGS